MRRESSYLRMNRMEDSRRMLERAHQVDSTAFFTYINLTSWAIRQNQPDEAVDLAREAIRLAPEQDDTHRAMAQAYAAQESIPEALASAERAVELGPENLQNHGLAGSLAMRGNRFQAARDYYQTATQLAPTFAIAWFGLVRAELALGDTEAASSALTSVTKLVPNHPTVQELKRELAGS